MADLYANENFPLPAVRHLRALGHDVLTSQESGLALPFPYSSQIEGRVRELRARYGKNQYRILYYCDANRVFVLLHACEKRSQKLPQREIRIAVARMNAEKKRKEG